MARITGQLQNQMVTRGAASAAEVCAPKDTAADFARRELEQIAQRMEVVSNRLSSAKKRLQEHFGVPAPDLTAPGAGDSMPPGMDGIRKRLDEIDARLHSIADAFEELI